MWPGRAGRARPSGLHTRLAGSNHPAGSHRRAGTGQNERHYGADFLSRIYEQTGPQPDKS